MVGCILLLVILMAGWQYYQSRRGAARRWSSVADAVDAGNKMRRALEPEPKQRAKRQTAEERAVALAPVWTLHWSEVDLHGDRVVMDRDAARCRTALTDVMQPHFPVVADLYLCYAIVFQIAREKKDAGMFGGAGVADWSIHQTERLWLHFCSHSGALDDGEAARKIFTAVNDERSEAVNSMKTSMLHAGVGITQADQLKQTGETALKRNTFSLSEFIEALVRVACVRTLTPAERKRGRLLTSEEVVRAVSDLLENVLVPHANKIGLTKFHEAMTDVPELNAMLLKLTTLHSKLYERFAGVKGIKLSKFLDLAELVGPDLARPRATAVFVQSLPVDVIYRSDAPKLLDPEVFQEALLRLGMLLEDEKSAGSAMMGAELAAPPTQMGRQRLTALSVAMESMESALSATSKRHAHPEKDAVTTIQKCARGRKDRKLVDDKRRSA